VTASPAPRTQLPPRLLPILYFGVAHVAFALACLAVALDPRGVSGFFYHSRMLAIVHLVTLGWITSSILGSLYIVGPIALRVWIPATWLDYIAFAFVLIGIVGMVTHFWLQEYGGMAWSAITVGSGILLVGVHVAGRLRHASLPRAVSAHIMLAFLNVLGAATLGVFIGFDKVYHFLPGFVLANVFAHAHLAALGWPPKLRTPDPAILQAGASFAWLAVASVLGVWLTFAASSSTTLRIAMAYGVFGVIGFLAQMVIGMEGRLLPVFAWYWAYANTGYKGPVRSQHEMPWRNGQELAFVLWLFGVPALAGGLAFDAIPLVSAGAWCLSIAALLDTVNVIRILRYAFLTPSSARL
jgi:hypothetical protein